MKTIIIDWDYPPKDLKNFVALFTSDCKIILTSACKDQDTIKQQLREQNSYLNDSLAHNLVILTSDPLIENTEDKKKLAAKQGEILQAYGTLSQDETTFISANLHARVVAAKFADKRLGSLPKPTILKPYQADPANFAMDKAERLIPSSGNTFASGSTQGVYKLAEKGNDSSLWYAKKRESSKLDRVQLEVFVSQTYHMLLGDHLPQSKYLYGDDNNSVFVLSKAVEGFANLNNPQALVKLEESGFKGVLPTLFLSMFLEEADLKAENMGVDSQGRFVKIDNDGAIASLVFKLGQEAAANYSFSQEDLENPHNPQAFNSATWQTQPFQGKQLETAENKKELYSLWQKMLQSKETILQLLEDTIDDPTFKQILREKMTNKFQRLENMLETHSEYQQFLVAQAQARQHSMKAELSTLRQQGATSELTTDSQNVFTV